MASVIYWSMCFWSRVAVFTRQFIHGLGTALFYILAGVGFAHFRLLVWYVGRAEAYALLLKGNPDRKAAVAKELEETLERLRRSGK
jgi:hypothetical protein